MFLCYIRPKQVMLRLFNTKSRLFFSITFKINIECGGKNKEINFVQHM